MTSNFLVTDPQTACVFLCTLSNRTVKSNHTYLPLKLNYLLAVVCHQLMVLSPVSNRDWTDPPWNETYPDPEKNILTPLRLKSERGRGCHKVDDPALKQYFVTMTTNIVSRLSDEESAKIDFTTISSSFELKDVYVTINQCTVSLVPRPVLFPLPFGDVRC